FASVHDVFKRNEEQLNAGQDGVEISRTLMRQMVNSMSTKLEIGSPMASLYLLGNPDHYKSHTYVNFAWRSYVAYHATSKPARNAIQCVSDFDDLLTIRNHNGSFVACSIVDNYRYRPVAYETVTLYEWVQSSDIKARTKGEKADFLSWLETNDALLLEKKGRRRNYRIIRHSFLPEHLAMYKSHSVHCDFRKLGATIPNFLGGALPRSDKGDRDYYCMSM
ncbi:hypothetical protein B0H17DRAFT_850661, partial [Mycena rosella]